MNIVELLDKALLDEQVKEQAVRYHGKWRPSLLGRCYRMQYWTRQQEPQTNPIDAKTLRVFKMGNMIHTLLQAQLPDNKCEQEFEFEDIVMHPDYFDDECVFDFKSIRSYGFKAMTKDSYDITTEQPQYLYQVMSEAMYLHKRYGELIFVDKDTLQTNLDIDKQFRFDIADWQEKIFEEMGILRHYWGYQKVPAPMPRCYHMKECKYCVYRNRCAQEEKQKDV